MNEQTVNRRAGVQKLFWGYLLLLADLNFNFFGLNLPLLPDSVGWLLVWLGAKELAPLRPSLKLLAPFCAFLGVLGLTQFLPFLEALLPGWLTPLTLAVSLYTHFQLFTDLAALAEEDFARPEFAPRLRSARNVLVVTRTALTCAGLVLNLPWLAVILALASLCAGVYALVQLWGLFRCVGRGGPARPSV